MAPPRFFKLNQYNWLGQKFLVQHRYDDLMQLRQNLSGSNHNTIHSNEKILDEFVRPVSDHLIYISSLALMKMSVRLDELIHTLQRLNFQKNGQYFLLLCQCLLYLGNHEAVIALCKQILNSEMNTLPSVGPDCSYDETACNDDIADSAAAATGSHKRQAWRLQQICDESMEFKRIFESVNQNYLINDPRLWFIFAQALEFQFQHGDADLAYRVACKLAAGQSRNLQKQNEHLANRNNPTVVSLSDSNRQLDNSYIGLDDRVGISNYYTPAKSYSEFCIRQRGDYRTAVQILSQAAQLSLPVDYTLNPVLASTLASQANSNASHFGKALEIINKLESHSVSLRNPSFVFNHLALKCKQKYIYHGITGRAGTYCDRPKRISDEQRYDLDFALAKSHVTINEMVQNSQHTTSFYKCPILPEKDTTSEMMPPKNTRLDQISTQIDKTLDNLRRCNSNCWTSFALWNNLGVCYLMKRRYIASLSCLTKAHQLNPLDWRISYNLSLVYLHVGLPVRALCSSLASKNHRQSLQQSIVLNTRNFNFGYHCPISHTIAAISYSEIQLYDEAKRFYTEMIASSRENGQIRAPLLALINYLILLYRDVLISKKENLVSVGRLLDLIEQSWLQRNPNDFQFSRILLNLASQIGEEQQKARAKNSYAWTRCNDKGSRW